MSPAGGRSVVGNVIWMGFAHAVTGIAQWCTLASLARLTTPEDVGVFSLGLAVVSPIVVFAELNLRGVIITDTRSEIIFGDYLGLRLLTLLLAMVVLLGVVVLGFYQGIAGAVILGIGIGRSIESISDLVHGQLQRKERVASVGISAAIRSVLSVVSIAVGVILGHSIIWGVVGWIVARVMVLTFYDLPICSNTLRASQQQGQLNYTIAGLSLIRPQWNASRLRRLIALTLPLGVVMMLVTVSGMVPLYFLDAFHGARQVGKYAAIAAFMAGSSAAMNAIGQAVSPRLSLQFANRQLAFFREFIVRLLWLGVGAGAAGVVLTVCFGDTLLAAFFGLEYAEEQSELILLMVGAGVSHLATILGYAIIATRHFRQLIAPYAVVTASSVLLSLLWVPGSGITGVVLVVLATSGLTVIGFTFVLWKIMRDQG